VYWEPGPEPELFLMQANLSSLRWVRVLNLRVRYWLQVLLTPALIGRVVGAVASTVRDPVCTPSILNRENI